MDVLSGLELAEKIAEKEPEISFAFLSAYDSFEYAVKALKIGARDYLTKPISAVELVGLLSKVKAAKEAELAAERVEENRESETAAADCIYRRAQRRGMYGEGYSQLLRGKAVFDRLCFQVWFQRLVFKSNVQKGARCFL